MTALDSIKQDLNEVESTIKILTTNNNHPDVLPKWIELRERLKSQYTQYIGAHCESSN
jgi:hypothetical protein